MNITRFFLVISLLLSTSAEARMYQWTDPDTGTTQLSGKPPVWYRATTDGPRVIVFENGKIIDDTSISISDDQRESLRQQALLKAEEDRNNAIRKAQEAEEMKARINLGSEEQPPPVSEEATTEIPEQPVQAEAQNQDLDEMKAEQMRALITEWEQQMTEQAKQKAGLGAGADQQE